jgi:hypothetical protein
MDTNEGKAAGVLFQEGKLYAPGVGSITSRPSRHLDLLPAVVPRSRVPMSIVATYAIPVLSWNLLEKPILRNALYEVENTGGSVGSGLIPASPGAAGQGNAPKSLDAELPISTETYGKGARFSCTVGHQEFGKSVYELLTGQTEK